MKEKKIITKEQVRYIIKRYRILIDHFSINEDGLIDVKGNVKICDGKLQKLPLRFRNVSGNFHCNSNCLKTLIGSPQWVGGSFDCSDNDLYTLKHGPITVRGNYRCSENNLITLKGCATEVGRDLLCNNNNLVNLKGSPDKIHGYFNCKMNKLRSLEGSPKEILGRFHISYNRLNDFSGAPQTMRCEIYATSNFLNNLKGLPVDFEGQLFIDGSTKSLNTGDIVYKKLELQLRVVNKFGHNFISPQLLVHYRHHKLIMKFQYYYDIWTIEDELDEPNFLMLIEDIEDGLL